MTNFWFNSKAVVVYALSLLALAEIIDLTIVAIAVPQMMGSLGTDLGSISYVTTSYVVSAAIFIPISGMVTRKLGMKRVVLLSAVLFTTSSVLCGTATSLAEMILFRVMQGIGGAFLPSIAQAYIAKSYSGKDQQMMMTIFGLIVVMGPILGPILGGMLTENYNWRWVFYVNVPICALGFLLIWLYMEEQPIEEARIDYLSFFFMALGVGCLEYFIDSGNQDNWFASEKLLNVFALSVVSFVFFIWRGLLGKSVVNLSLFKNLNFTLSCVAMFLFTAVVTGTLAYFPTMLQQIYNYPVDIAGYVTAPRGIAALIGAPVASYLINKIGSRLTMFFGAFFFSVGCFMLMNFGPKISAINIVVAMMLQGFSMMAFFLPIVQICFIGVSNQEEGDASGSFNFFRNFACSVGTSVAATILSHQSQVNYQGMNQYVSPYANGYSWWVQNLKGVPETIQVAVASLEMQFQGLLISYLDIFYFFGMVLLLMLWLPFMLKEIDSIATKPL